MLALPLGCTSVAVDPVDASEQIQRVCIERNAKVILPAFLRVVRAGFLRHGIETEVHDGPPPSECEFVLKYTALQSVVSAPFLAHAELHLERSGEPIAHAIYHLRGAGGFRLTMYQSTEKKMDPVIDQLLSAYPSASSSP